MYAMRLLYPAWITEIAVLLSKPVAVYTVRRRIASRSAQMGIRLRMVPIAAETSSASGVENAVSGPNTAAQSRGTFVLTPRRCVTYPAVDRDVV